MPLFSLAGSGILGKHASILEHGRMIAPSQDMIEETARPATTTPPYWVPVVCVCVLQRTWDVYATP
jgi:hypothetical protein